jgi:hypothetical protein
VICPADPLFKEQHTPAARWLRIDVLEDQLHAPRTCRFEVGRRECSEQCALLGCQVRRILGPDVARAFQLGACLHLGAADLVDDIADQLHDVEAVEGDLGLGQVLGGARDEGRAHVDRGPLDAGGIAAARFEMIGKLPNSAGASPIGDKDDPASVNVDDESYVVLIALCAGLVDANPRVGVAFVIRDGPNQ